MKLHHAVPSPYARKVHIAALELGLMDKIELVTTPVAPGKENTEYANNVNPLRKIPALKTDSGDVVLDSSVICEYLNDLHGKHQLVPVSGDAKVTIQTRHAMANGIMDAAVSMRYETFLRPEQYRWQVWIDEQQEKIDNALAWFDTNELSTNMTLDNIALACAIGYIDFRTPDYDWRSKYTTLASWFASIEQNEHYQATKPE